MFFFFFSLVKALAQCSTYLKDLNAVREAVFDTTYGAKLVHSEQLADTAAIASEEAAEQYGLQILERDIHDKERGVNIQRYLILARYATLPSHFKNSLCALSLLFVSLFFFFLKPNYVVIILVGCVHATQT